MGRDEHRNVEQQGIWRASLPGHTGEKQGAGQKNRTEYFEHS